MSRARSLALLLVLGACKGSDVATPSAIALTPAAVSFGALRVVGTIPPSR